MVPMKILEQKQLLSKKISKGLLRRDKLDQGFAKSYVENIICITCMAIFLLLEVWLSIEKNSHD